MSDAKNYLRNGYVHIKSPFSESEIAKMRKAMLQGGNESSVKGIDFLLANKEIYSGQLDKTISGRLANIFGSNYKIVNDINIHLDQFYNDRPDKGWHIDAGAERLARYLFSSDYRFCKVGIYLQPNSKDLGGGVDVEVGGQNSFRFFGSGNFGYFLSLSYYFFDRLFISKFRKKISVELEAGDVLVFDSRLPHRSTPKKRKREAKEPEKLVIYWQIAGDRKNAFLYLKNAMFLEFSDKGNFRHYSEYLGYHYPTDYPDEYCQLVSDNIEVVSLPGNIASRYKDKIPEGALNEVFFPEQL